MMRTGLDRDGDRTAQARTAVPDRFHCPDLDPAGASASLVGDEAHHLARVLRATTGTSVELFDGRGRAVAAVVTEVTKNRVELTVGPALPDRAPAIALTLAVAPPKGDRLDWLVEKATELGVSKLISLRTERTEVDPRPAKLDRLRRRILEACKQCGRARLMDLEGPIALADLLSSEPGNAVRRIAHPGGMPAGSRPDADRRPAIVAIGPEGGFSDREIADANARGWTTIGLGPTILRVETAALAASALILMGSHTGQTGDETRHA